MNNHTILSCNGFSQNEITNASECKEYAEYNAITHNVLLCPIPFCPALRFIGMDTAGIADGEIMQKWRNLNPLRK